MRDINFAQAHHFSVVEKLGFCALYLCLSAALVFAGAHSFRAFYESEFKKNSDYIAQGLNADLVQIRGVLTSLSSLHFASSDFSRDELESYLQQLLNTYPFIRSTGRFDFVPHPEAQLFMQEMQEQGIYGFEIRDILANGQLRGALPREGYHAISAFEPLNPITARFLGVDVIYSDNKLGRIFQGAIDSNSTVFVTPPHFWSTSDNLVAFQPTYLGRRAPETLTERTMQYDGGFWFDIDLQKLLQKSQLNKLGYAAELCLGSAYSESSSCLYTQDEKHTSGQFLKFFSPYQWQNQWFYGEQVLTLKFTQQMGLSKKSSSILITVWLLASGLYLSLIQAIKARRETLRQIERSQPQLHRERELAAVTLEAIGDAVITTDEENRISYMNPAAETLTGWDFRDARGLKVDRVAPLQKTLQPLDSINGGCDLSGDTEMLIGREDSKQIFVNNTRSRLHDRSGQPVGDVLVLHDVTLTRQLTNALMHQANHDSLTGLANRRKFECTLNTLIEAQPKKQLNHGLCYIDLDQFKLVNDTCGHTAGDKLLENLSQNLQQMVRRNDLLARLGGDEFGMIIIDCDPDTAEQVAHRLYDFFQSFFFNWEGKVFAVRASIGFVPIKPQDHEISDILAAADLACYAAKDKGRNSLHIYRPEDDNMVQRKGEMRWLMRLQTALRDDGFLLYSQPICQLQTQPPKPTRHELLLRLREDDGTVITPFQFIQAAERYDLMREIDRWVISHAFEIVRSLRGTPYKNDVFCVNLSGQSTTDPSLSAFISRELVHYDIDPRLICFEFTETAIIENLCHAQELIAHLHELGCTVALDDFGSGVSSFGYLKRLKVDYLKIDGQFVKEMLNNKVDLEMVRSIHNVGKVLGIQTIAEFVEDGETADALKSIGIDYGQGYHFGKPSDVHKVIGAQRLRVVGG